MVASPGYGQVSVQFMPEVYGNSVNGLMNATIYNASGVRSVRLMISVTERKAGKVLSLRTEPFTIVPGANRIPGSALKSGAIVMNANKISNFIRRTQTFPQGSYEYNFNVIAASSSSEELIDMTFDHEITPPAPLDLVEPYDKDQICEQRPMLSWQPSIPKAQGTQYEVVVAEIKEGQNAVEALNYNLPVVNQKGVINNILMYPPVAKALEEGKSYAWQVTAYVDQTIINRSEVWSFKQSCQDTAAVVPDSDLGYRDIEDLIKGNYYVADGTLKFALVNSYEEQRLKYTISSLTNPDKKIRNLPKVTLKRGQNKVKLNLSSNMAFDEHHSYILKVQMPDGSQKTLRFIYKTTL
ncbi:DUF928 domain-containing protein [Pedobacter sp. BAL39]|uniref:DUF928 domain-containing protein n=1 Tax=Pedobacter sp. BAL39 TaxID=391596 RepID=UPI0012F94BFC|nr:DUF928 domain-containing protein [Pedobacter sp. BAL39]